jgi:transcriptional regulator with XRE-family HTH domain
MATSQTANFGEWLKQAREARGLTIEAITQQTRIPRQHLDALEHGVLDLLPDFYERAEVRAFAKAVGMDEQLAIERFNAVTAPQPPAAAEPEAQLTGRLSMASALLAVIAVALVAWVAGRPGPGEDPAPRATSAALARTDPGPAAGLGAAPEAEPVTAVPAVAEVAPSGAGSELVVRTQPEGARVTVNGIGWGTSPVAIRHLPPGDKRIRVSKAGYASIERVLAADGRERESVEIALPPLPGDR